MNPADPLTFLFSLERLGMKFGLENMAKLCARLGHPQRSFRSVHVAGTNGKGSVAAMVETALRAAGHRTGRYTSPHLERVEERFALDGRDVETDALRESVARVQRAVEDLMAQGTLAATPTFFEVATAAAFELFRTRQVDVAVLEVGLGGRLDATNIVSPVCAAITSIGLDHQAQLGDTLESIAWEKAGVVKPGVPLVCGRMPGVAEAVIGRVCAERGAPFRPVTERVHVDVQQPIGPPVATFESTRRRLADVTLGLDGRHQIDNAAVAIELLDAIEPAGLDVADAAVRTGLTSVRWPGRLERRHWRGADFLLDAAHNPAGASALAAYLSAGGWRGATLVFGVMRDKDAAGMLAALAPVCGEIVFTTPPTPRALPASELPPLLAAIGEAPAACVVPDPAAALARAARTGARVVVAGSLFLIGPVRDILR